MKTVFLEGNPFSTAALVRSNGYTAFVERDGSVTVADPVTGQRTSCHSLTPSQCEAVRAALAYSTIKI